MCISIFILSIIFVRRSIIRKYPTDCLLLANPYIAMIVASPYVFDMCIYSIYGYLHPESSFDGFWCRFKSYLTHINGYVYFYSFLLQGIYRFFRIVYHTQIQFQSFRVYAIASGFLWINGFLQMLPSLFFRHIDYMPYEYHCQFPLTYLSGSLIGLSIMCIIPYILTLVFYMCTIFYVRKQSVRLRRIKKRFKRRRDVVIFGRIVVLFTFVTIMAMPHLLIPIIYTVFDKLPSWACPFEWLMVVMALVGVIFIQIFMFLFLNKLIFR